MFSQSSCEGLIRVTNRAKSLNLSGSCLRMLPTVRPPLGGNRPLEDVHDSRLGKVSFRAYINAMYLTVVHTKVCADPEKFEDGGWVW